MIRLSSRISPQNHGREPHGATMTGMPTELVHLNALGQQIAFASIWAEPFDETVETRPSAAQETEHDAITSNIQTLSLDRAELNDQIRAASQTLALWCDAPVRSCFRLTSGHLKQLRSSTTLSRGRPPHQPTPDRTGRTVLSAARARPAPPPRPRVETNIPLPVSYRSAPYFPAAP